MHLLVPQSGSTKLLFRRFRGSCEKSKQKRLRYLKVPKCIVQKFLGSSFEQGTFQVAPKNGHQTKRLSQLKAAGKVRHLPSPQPWLTKPCFQDEKRPPHFVMMLPASAPIFYILRFGFLGSRVAVVLVGLPCPCGRSSGRLARLTSLCIFQLGPPCLSVVNC